MKLQKTVGLQAATHNLGAGWEGRRCAPLASTMWTSLAFLSWKWRFPQVRLFSDIKGGPIHERRDLVELRTFRWLDGWWMMMLMMMMMMLIITLRFLLGSHVRSSSSVDANYYNYHDSNLIRSITHPLKFLRIDECAVKCSASYQYSILELIALNDLKYTPEMLSTFCNKILSLLAHSIFMPSIPFRTLVPRSAWLEARIADAERACEAKQFAFFLFFFRRFPLGTQQIGIDTSL